MTSSKARIVHLIYRLDTGGMEHILASVIAGTRESYEHIIIAIEGLGKMAADPSLDGISCFSIEKRPGKDWGHYLRLWRLLRKLRPHLVQTYNLGTIDLAPVAKSLGGVIVVHAEHGRDNSDPGGTSRKYRLLRRGMSLFVDYYIVVSRDLLSWMVHSLGISSDRIFYIPNGIDYSHLSRAMEAKASRDTVVADVSSSPIVIGSVGRLDPVKDHVNLLHAFRYLKDSIRLPSTMDLRLVIVGDGKERRRLESLVTELGLSRNVDLVGMQDDIGGYLSRFDIFVLSSRAEGMPLTVLEAMAVALPVVATRVGAIPEIVSDGRTGFIVPPENPRAMASALAKYIADTELRRQHGGAGLRRVRQEFGLQPMLAGYRKLYDALLGRIPVEDSMQKPDNHNRVLR